MSEPAPTGTAPLLRELLQAGVGAFDRGAYWHAHEHWEEPWRRSQASPRHFLQGLIQVAAALHHAQRGRRDLALRLVGRALAHLHQGLPAARTLGTGVGPGVVAFATGLRQQLGRGDPLLVPPLAPLLHGR